MARCWPWDIQSVVLVGDLPVGGSIGQRISQIFLLLTAHSKRFRGQIFFTAF
jgi:hypothetical protein